MIEIMKGIKKYS